MPFKTNQHSTTSQKQQINPLKPTNTLNYPNNPPDYHIKPSNTLNYFVKLNNTRVLVSIRTKTKIMRNKNHVTTTK